MTAYVLILFAVAVLFLVIGIMLYCGKTELIHDYHQEKVAESSKKEYGKAFAKAMFTVFLTACVSGIISLCGNIAVSAAVLFVGLTVSIVMIVKVQKKYNNGIFSERDLKGNK